MSNNNYQSINDIDFNQEINNETNNETNNQTYILIITRFIFDLIIVYGKIVEIIIFYILMINILYNYTQTKYNNNILFSEFSIFYYTVYHFITQITIQKSNNELNEKSSNEVKNLLMKILF